MPQYVQLFNLASGGMGDVELVMRREGRFERLYARKRLRNAQSESARNMFLDEARVAGLLRHPNVVPVLDTGTDDDGPYLVMEWIDGIPLHHLIARVAQDGPLPISLCARIGSQTADGLHAAHELVTHDGQRLELVHRDVSPQNILVGFDGIVRVADFGVSKVRGGERTESGVLKGKLSYLAPELLQFEKPDRRADLFALGVVLFELCSGTRLYGLRNADHDTVAKRILHEPPPVLAQYRRDAPPELEALLTRLMAKSPEHRPESAADVRDQLNTIAADYDTGLTLTDYLLENFEDQRRAMQMRISQSIQHVRDKPAAPKAGASKRTRSPAAMAAVVISLLTLAITMWSVMRHAEAPAVTAHEVAADPIPTDPTGADSTGANSVPATSSPASSAQPDSSADRAEANPSAASTTPRAVSQTEATWPAMAPRPQRPRMRRRPRPAKTQSTPEDWGWGRPNTSAQ